MGLKHGAWAWCLGVRPGTCSSVAAAGPYLHPPPPMQALFRGPNKHGLWEQKTDPEENIPKLLHLRKSVVQYFMFLYL